MSIKRNYAVGLVSDGGRSISCAGSRRFSPEIRRFLVAGVFFCFFFVSFFVFEVLFCSGSMRCPHAPKRSVSGGRADVSSWSIFGRISSAIGVSDIFGSEEDIFSPIISGEKRDSSDANTSSGIVASAPRNQSGISASSARDCETVSSFELQSPLSFSTISETGVEGVIQVLFSSTGTEEICCSSSWGDISDEGVMSSGDVIGISF
jgi:hypothetical protein